MRISRHTYLAVASFFHTLLVLVWVSRRYLAHFCHVQEQAVFFVVATLGSQATCGIFAYVVIYLCFRDDAAQCCDG